MSAGQILEFELAGRRYALPVSDVAEILRAVAITSLPGAPDVVEGVIDVRGHLVPVMDLRRRLGLPAKAVELSDHLVVSRAKDRMVALRADRVRGLVEVGPGAVESARDLMPEAEYVAGIVRLPDGMVLIHDLHRFLSSAEEGALEAALKRHRESEESA